MKAHTQTFKENLTTLGKEVNARVTYIIDGVTTELDGDELSSVTPHYEGNLLKSVMKQVDIISDVDIPLNTEVNVQFGMKYDDDEFEYVDYGNYIVFSSEKQEDTNNYKIIAYDKMLYAMKDYEQLFETNLYQGQLEQGSIAGADGVPFDNTIRVRSVDFLEVEPSTTYTIDFDNTDMDYIVFKYQEDGTYISRVYEGWITTKPYTFTTDNNATKIKVLFRYKNDATIELEDVQNIILKKGTQDTIIYPVSIKEYIENLCSKIGLEFANSNEVFANYDKEIPNELYSNLGYTYRDVLDELAQVTASTICINDEDKLEIRYLNESVNDSEEVETKDITITNGETSKIGTPSVEGETTQYTTTGKNLLNIYTSRQPLYKETIKGVTFTLNFDGSIFVNGTNDGTGNSDFYVFGTWSTTAPTIITLDSASTFSVSSNATTSNIYLYLVNKQSALRQLTNTNSSGSVASGSEVTAFFVRVLSGKNANNITLYPQLENGASATSFEKYSGGVASPNPSYEQQIENKTGLQQCSIIGKNYLNLKDENLYRTSFASVSYNITSPNSIHAETTSGSYSRVWFNLDLPNVSSITISAKAKASEETFDNVGIGVDRFLIGDTTRNYFAETWFSASDRTNGTRKSFTITNIDTTKYRYRISFFVTQTRTEANKVDFYDIQIEKGNTATDFEKYKGNTYDINLGKNLYEGSKEFSGTWSNANQWTTADETYNGLVVKKRNSAWSGLKKSIYVNAGETYTYSLYAKSDASRNCAIYIAQSDAVTEPNYTDITTTTEWKRYSLTFRVKTSGYIGARFENKTTIADNYTYICGYQLEKGDKATPYSEDFEPIELCKIGDYQDLIFKGEGVNIVKDKYINTATTQYATVLNVDCELKPSTTYTISFYGTPGNVLYINENLFDSTGNFTVQNGRTYITKTTKAEISKSNTTQFDTATQMWRILKNQNNQSSANVFENLQIQEGNVLTDFEPYGSKGKWLLHKEIDKTIFDGNSSRLWGVNSVWDQSNPTILHIFSNDLNNLWLKGQSGYFSNRFICTTESQRDFNKEMITTHTTTTTPYIFISYDRLTGVTSSSSTAEKITALNNWLSNNRTNLYFVLAIPTTTEITKDNYPELLSQLKALDKAKTYEGTTNITSSFPIKFSYATDYETINEDYIKNTRASFGEKYGPINSIVLSRSADSDNIYIQDEQSIEANGLCELKISDNQIMNSNNRNEYLDDLLSYLGGIEYYTNDYESIGITYLDLCDKYKVQIGDTKYDCLMFNDEVGIHDGLNEIIYTKKLEQTQTDYKKATTTDKLKRQTSLIVDKQNERIEAIVGDVGDEFSSIRVDINGIKSQVQGYDVTIDELGNEIQTLRTSYTEQTPTMISDWFDTNLKAALDDLQNTANGNDEEIRKIKAYVRRGVITDPQSPYYNQAYIELGDETNQTTLRILQNRIQFLTNGQETAFISNNQLYINESTILTKEKVGHWVTTEDEDGLLNTYWED